MENPFKRLVPLSRKVEEARVKATEALRAYEEDLPAILVEDDRLRRERFAEAGRKDAEELAKLERQIAKINEDSRLQSERFEEEQKARELSRLTPDQKLIRSHEERTNARKKTNGS